MLADGAVGYLAQSAEHMDELAELAETLAGMVRNYLLRGENRPQEARLRLSAEIHRSNRGALTMSAGDRRSCWNSYSPQRAPGFASVEWSLPSCQLKEAPRAKRLGYTVLSAWPA